MFARRLVAASRSRYVISEPGRASGVPHVVPVTFAVLTGAALDDRIVFVIDGKPKSGRPLKRLTNIAANPRVSLVVDHYDDTAWSNLWWVRADGRARIADDVHEREEGLVALRAKYAQYRGDVSTQGPLVVIDVDRWSAWSPS